MDENNLEILDKKDYVVEDGELPVELELKKLEVARDSLMRQQENIIDNFTAMEVALESKEAKEVLDPISRQLEEANRQIQEIGRKEAA